MMAIYHLKKIKISEQVFYLLKAKPLNSIIQKDRSNMVKYRSPVRVETKC